MLSKVHGGSRKGNVVKKETVEVKLGLSDAEQAWLFVC